MRDGTTAGAEKFRHNRHRTIVKKVNTSRASHRKGSTADTGSSGGRRPSVGKRRLIRGGGLVTRISDDKEPQFHINRKYRHQPVVERDTVNRVETMWPNGYGPEWNRKNYNDPTPKYPDSDESDSDEMLPLGAFWPTPEEEEWTIVGKPHTVQRYDKDIDCNRLHYTRDKLDRSGMCCKQLDYIDCNVTRYDSDKFLPERLVTEVGILNTVDGYTRSEVLPTRRNEAAQNNSSPFSSRKGPQSHRLTSEPVLTSVRPSFRKRPNVIAVETRKTAGVLTARPVDIVPMPQVMVDENRCNRTVFGEMFPEEPDVGPAKIAEEANTGGATNEQHLHDDQNFKKTTITKLPQTLLKFRNRRSRKCLLNGRGGQYRRCYECTRRSEL